MCGYVGVQQALHRTSRTGNNPPPLLLPNPAPHNQTQAKVGAGYLGPPWYCSAQYILTRGSPLLLDVELGIINGVDV